MKAITLTLQVMVSQDSYRYRSSRHLNRHIDMDYQLSNLAIAGLAPQNQQPVIISTSPIQQPVTVQSVVPITQQDERPATVSTSTAQRLATISLSTTQQSVTAQPAAAILQQIQPTTTAHALIMFTIISPYQSSLLGPLLNKICGISNSVIQTYLKQYIMLILRWRAIAHCLVSFGFHYLACVVGWLFLPYPLNTTVSTPHTVVLACSVI